MITPVVLTDRTVYISINGILTWPGDANGWTDRFVTWMHIHAKGFVQAEKFEYWTTALTRNFGQARRTDQIVWKIGFYRRAGYRVVLVGHSNGCDLIARVLDVIGQEVDAVHLFSPATHGAIFDDAISNRVVRRIHIYGSRNDGALKFARFTYPLIGWCGLGYGSLGLSGREFAADHPGIVEDHSNDKYGHSGWFTRGAVFEDTMKLFLANDEADVKSLPV